MAKLLKLQRTTAPTQSNAAQTTTFYVNADRIDALIVPAISGDDKVKLESGEILDWPSAVLLYVGGSDEPFRFYQRDEVLQLLKTLDP